MLTTIYCQEVFCFALFFKNRIYTDNVVQKKYLHLKRHVVTENVLSLRISYRLYFINTIVVDIFYMSLEMKVLYAAHLGLNLSNIHK